MVGLPYYKETETLKPLNLLALIFILSLIFSAPAWSFDDDFHDPFEDVGTAAPDITDPLEPLNRLSFWVNDKIYRYFLSPLNESVSAGLREALCNGLSVCIAPVRTVHGGMEFRFRDGGSEFGRLALGYLLQVLDRPFSDGEVPDLERILARAGLGTGPYLVLPVLGPSTVRDGVGKIASFYLESPVALLEPAGAESGSSLGDALVTYNNIHRGALDPYLSVRSLFSQQNEKENRSFQIASNSYLEGG